MGLLEKLKGGAKFNQMSKAMAEVIEQLDQYDYDDNVHHLYMASWITRVGIMDIMEQYHYSMSAPIYVTIDNVSKKMILREAMQVTIGGLSTRTKRLTDMDDREIIEDIAQKGAAFYKIDKNIPYSVKKKYIYK